MNDEVPVWLTYPSDSLVSRHFIEDRKYLDALKAINESKPQGIDMIKVKLLSPDAKLPSRSFHSAAYDLYACETTDCPPGKVTMVPIGIATELPPGHAALVWDRSGMGKKGLHVFGGVIDEDYRGEWWVMLFNSTNETYTVNWRDRVAQFVVQAVIQEPVQQVEELSDTKRGEAGFSSTGR